ncbi:MAG: hypothetical protein Alpg2KO_00460 [Alphaproteobacteria bacterium]
MHELHSHISVEQALPPALRQTGADIDGATIDLQGKSAVEFIVSVGAEGDAFSSSVGFNVILETADDDGTGAPDTWAPETNAQLYLGAASDDGNDVQTSGIALSIRENGGAQDYRFGYKGGKRFARLNLVAVGTQGTGTIVSATAVTVPLLKPADAQNGE